MELNWMRNCKSNINSYHSQFKSLSRALTVKLGLLKLPAKALLYLHNRLRVASAEKRQVQVQVHTTCWTSVYHFSAITCVLDKEGEVDWDREESALKVQSIIIAILSVTVASESAGGVTHFRCWMQNLSTSIDSVIAITNIVIDIDSCFHGWVCKAVVWQAKQMKSNDGCPKGWWDMILRVDGR